MKREIKFRAWDKVDKRMIVHEQEFIPLKVTNVGVLRLNPHHKENFWEFALESRFALMVNIGCYDKNGEDIYEDDIVLTNEAGWIAKVCIDFKNGSYCEDNNGGFAGYCNWEEFKIIGNIHENPALCTR
jgi:hypothetical protein